MDDDMEDSFELTFDCFEIDPDYEFDASRFFDFTRSESPSEARAAELWFETVPSYPPSPFITKLSLREDVATGNLTVFSKPKDVEQSNHTATYSENASGFSVPRENFKERGVFFNCPKGHVKSNEHAEQAVTSSVLDRFLNNTMGWNHDDKAQDISVAKTKPFIRAPFSIGSTLMKPTASQLAKQNRPREVKCSSQFAQRLQKSLVQKNEKNLENPSKNECQASKRQKLEGGQLCKLFDIKQQTNLMHKIPKKDGPVDGNVEQRRLKLTIPREPELETSQRARRMRPKSSTEVGGEPSTVPLFKACPLNRKILEAPSMALPQKSTPRLPEFHEFHLKTSERARQHISSSSLLHCTNSDNVAQKHVKGSIVHLGGTGAKRFQQQSLNSSQSRKPHLIDNLKREENETIPKFKARPLNKKIFSSKGDIGIFRTCKREMTVPREFNFMTNKRFQQNPPVELFNKLSLASEPQQNTLHRPTLPPRPTKELRRTNCKIIVSSGA